MLTALYRLADFARDRGRRRSWEPEHAAGRRGEDIAHRFLRRAGMTVVARNYRPPSGSSEIDLVAWDRDTLVFVEVKSRSDGEHGSPDLAVDAEKQRAILRGARDYARRADVPLERIRFDILTVVFNTPPAVTHRKDVFSVRPLANIQ